MRVLKYFLVSLVLAVAFVGLGANSYAESTITIPKACEDAITAGDKAPAFCEAYQKEPADDPIITTINKVANFIAFITGAIAVIMVMYAGYQFITSDGNSEKVSRARQTIFYAAIGLVVIITSRLLVSFAIMVFIK